MQTTTKKRTLMMFNPAAGKGKGPRDEAHYTTKEKGDGRRFIKEECEKAPDTHFIVCGGDGTLNEAVCGIMDAGAGHMASLTAHPCGSGNDTVKSFPTDKKGETVKLDVIKLNDRYGINMINIGFDCNVVSSAAMFKHKWKLAGKISYILGVIREFFRPIGENYKIDAVLEDGSSFSYHGPTLLCAICNGQWCGGSFHNSPYSDMRDGVLELVLVKKTGRINFIKMIGRYQNGTLIGEQGKITPEAYSTIVSCHRIRSVTVTGMKRVCTDGEVEEMSSAAITVLPQAIQYTYG
ncbi:MAG: hypothetical protein IJY89_01460 [Clostridia bacterium]|nr:hypothetical protein [Clostridia bacterium]